MEIWLRLTVADSAALDMASPRRCTTWVLPFTSDRKEKALAIAAKTREFWRWLAKANPAANERSLAALLYRLHDVFRICSLPKGSGCAWVAMEIRRRHARNPRWREQLTYSGPPPPRCASQFCRPARHRADRLGQGSLPSNLRQRDPRATGQRNRMSCARPSAAILS